MMMGLNFRHLAVMEIRDEMIITTLPIEIIPVKEEGIEKMVGEMVFLRVHWLNFCFNCLLLEFCLLLLTCAE